MPRNRGIMLRYFETTCSLPVPVNSDKKTEEKTDGQTLTRERAKTKRPSLYQVVLLNDDFTPMDFVVLVLKKYFRKNEADAQQIMLDVHQKGSGVAGVYPFEVAETKVYMVNQFAKSEQHPLKCVLKEAPEEE